MIRSGWAPPTLGARAFLPPVRLAGPAQPSMGLARYTLGQTAAEWYERARAALAEYEFLLDRVDRIDNKTERERILTWIGDPSVPGTPAYRYRTVKSDSVSDVAREGVGAYNVERRQGRIEELEDYNKELESLIETALEVHGVRETEVRTEVRTELKDLTLPILGGAALVGLAIWLAV